MEEAGEAQVADPYGAGGGDHYVGGFEVAVEDPVAVQVEEPVEELEEDGADHAGGDGPPGRLGVVVDYLEEVVLAVLEDHVDGFFFEEDLD